MRPGNEVGERGCALIDGLYSVTADDRVSFCSAGLTVTGRRCHFLDDIEKSFLAVINFHLISLTVIINFALLYFIKCH